MKYIEDIYLSSHSFCSCAVLLESFFLNVFFMFAQPSQIFRLSTIVPPGFAVCSQTQNGAPI